MPVEFLFEILCVGAHTPNKIVEFGGEKIPQGHKDIFDPNLPTDQTEKVPGKPGI
ncbi:E domain-containing protein, partial [Staphylococcus aureus]